MKRKSLVLLAGVLMLVAIGTAVAAAAFDAQLGVVRRAVVPMLAADSAPGQAGLVFCTVTSVTDGDTIDVGGCPDAGRVRLLLVDAPELSPPARCFSREATDYVRRHLLGRSVGLERDTRNVDRFDRLLRYVWLDGQLFNERMVRDGMAVLLVIGPDVKHRDRIAAAQTEARAANRGLWGACGGVDAPATPTPPGAATPTPTRTPTPLATPTPGGACEAATARIVSLNKVDEVVVIEGSGNMTGWYLISERGEQRFDFPAGFTLNGRVEIVSDTPAFPNTATRLWWSSAAMWNNTLDDDALLHDCLGRLVQTFEDGH
jgi:micrococcal nuclease